MTGADTFRTMAEALRADAAAGGDLTGWKRRFTGDGFASLLERLHADPVGTAPVVHAWLEFVGVYASALAERGPPVPKRVMLRPRPR